MPWVANSLSSCSHFVAFPSYPPIPRQWSCLFLSRSFLYFSLSTFASSLSFYFTNAAQSSFRMYVCFTMASNPLLMKLRVRSLLWVLQLLATICIIFLHAIAFNSSRNYNQGWTHSSNIVILSCSLSELNKGRTKEILCLAIRPTSLLILIWALFSVGNPVGVSPMMVSLSSSHRVTILFLVEGL